MESDFELEGFCGLGFECEDVCDGRKRWMLPALEVSISIVELGLDEGVEELVVAVVVVVVIAKANLSFRPSALFAPLTLTSNLCSISFIIGRCEFTAQRRMPFRRFESAAMSRSDSRL